VYIFSYWIYAGPGCIVHLPLVGSAVGVWVDPSGGGQFGVAGYMRKGISIPAGLTLRMNVPPAAVHVALLAATCCWLPFGKSSTQLLLVSGPWGTLLEPVRVVHANVGSPF
jgi:hypothetical protein